MDPPPDRFGHQPHQVCPYRLYSSPPGATPSGPAFPSSDPPSYPLISHLLQPGGPRNCGVYQYPGSFTESCSEREDEEDEEEGAEGEKQGRGMAPPLSQLLPLGKRRCGSDIGDWCQELLRMKRLRAQTFITGKGEGPRGQGPGGAGLQDRRERREERWQARQELKEKLQETRGKLLELQQRVWQVYGRRQREGEEHRWAEEGAARGGRRGVEDGEMHRDEGAEVFLEEEEENNRDQDRAPSQKPLPGHSHNVSSSSNREKYSNKAIGKEDLDRGKVWLECGLVRGEWEARVGGGQKFVQALKQELGSAVARVIDRVVHMYSQSQPPSMAGLAPPDGEGQKRQGVSRFSGTAASLEQPEALPSAVRSLPGKKPAPSQSSHQNLLLHQLHPGLPHLPHTYVPPLLPTRVKEPFLPSYPPAPAPLSLPVLHYTMQHMLARSLATLPLRRECLSPDTFLDFHPHTPSFPPIRLLDPLEPPLPSDRGRDRGVRGVVGGSGGGYADGGDSSLYLPPGSSHDGLTPCHLKKAKLMFFYTRYPSSNTLKTYFPDVKFNRCITSQLIKWFSNFREFFYIQMERFARQALREGMAGGGGEVLRLRRDSELFRTLNLHYNKSNDYHVPERFVEISELALREFFTAIQAGHDSDPCWKKSIYKIICKLDSPVPDCFRMPGCPTDIHSTT
ncbi:prospero homeobox 3 [Megalops cyprinoides]|uniref:prospero homeobox 3 n=1 Tax=Megalops cyprinoides TaxID=118141 RepID=UPI00186467E4|nr:prospero homeobox 3 [Megalops cyprinoides]